jgi:hypothetical protein
MADVKLVVVYNDCAKPVTFRRSDTNERTGCPDCSAFMSDGKCLMGRVRSCWPLYEVACSEWSLRHVPHETQPCLECGKPVEKYQPSKMHPGCAHDRHMKQAYDDFIKQRRA